MKIKLEIGNLSDVGRKRTANEDYFGFYQGVFGSLIIVCDGMGGNKGGALASRLAVETIKAHFEKLPTAFDEKAELKLALTKADNLLKERACESDELKEMGSTAVVLLIKENLAFTAHIGDSRIYMIRNNQIHQLTKDHSLVQQMVDANIISEEAAKEHPKRNVITRSLGADGSSEPEIAEPFSIFKKDMFVLCTDGLTGYIDENKIFEVVSNNTVQASCAKLIDMANERGGKDNITVQIVSVVKGKSIPMPNPLKNKTVQLVLSGLLFTLVLAWAIVTFKPYSFLFGNSDKKIEKTTPQKPKTENKDVKKEENKNSAPGSVTVDITSDEKDSAAEPNTDSEVIKKNIETQKSIETQKKSVKPNTKKNKRAPK